MVGGRDVSGMELEEVLDLLRDVKLPAKLVVEQAQKAIKRDVVLDLSDDDGDGGGKRRRLNGTIMSCIWELGLVFSSVMFDVFVTNRRFF